MPISHWMRAWAAAFMFLGQAAHAGPLEIAPPEEALTFARSYHNGMPDTLLLVTHYDTETVTGIDMSQALGRPVFDPIILYQALGREAILDALKVIPESAAISVPTHTLGMPVGLGGHHIAAAANFKAHADDAEVEDGPFLFAKKVQPTPWNAPIPAGDALLDYEAELCFVPLRDFPAVRPSKTFGLILCNDVTDRARLLQNVDASNVRSGRGFLEGKSAPGYLPVGNLFVIPTDARAFANALTLWLAVNGETRQEAPVSQMVWSLDDILLETEGIKSRRWMFAGKNGVIEAIGLPLENGRVPARAMILSGTPAGTVFEGIRPLHKVRGVLDYILGGWSRGPAYWVAKRYIAEEQTLGRYLKAGDRVHIRVDRMGELQNPVVD